MAGETTATGVNPQITDAVSTAVTAVIAQSPAMAMGSLYQSISNSMAMAAMNAVFAQQQAYINYMSATTLAVTEMLQPKKES